MIKDVYYKMIQCNISIIIDLEEIIKNKGSERNIQFMCGIIRGSSHFLIDTALTRVPLKILLLNIEALHRIYVALLQCLFPNRLIVSPFVLLESELNNLIAITEDLIKKINVNYDLLRKELTTMNEKLFLEMNDEELYEFYLDNKESEEDDE